MVDYLLVGRTGLGKSTTGNKLLGADKAISEPLVSVTDSGAIWREGEDAVKYFVTGDGSESVTAQCKLLLSKEKELRVLDTPGFANDRLTKECGPLECNRRIFRWILREQEKHELAIRRVLYFLPKRGPLERAEGALQEEIKVMYDFLGQDIFNIMVIIATNKKDSKYQTEFDEEDIRATRTAFTAAFERVTNQHLPKCPPILYLPFNEKDVLNKIQSAKVVKEEPLKKLEPFVIDVTHEDIDTMIREAKQINPGRRLQFQDRCIHCVSKVIYEDTPSGMWAVKVVEENGDEVPLRQSRCHPKFIRKPSTVRFVRGAIYLISLSMVLAIGWISDRKILPLFTKHFRYVGGVVHLITLGIFLPIGWILKRTILPWFTNTDEICLLCKQSRGSIGCSDVGKVTNLSLQGEQNVNKEIFHSTRLDRTEKAC